jgi:hypothetical protein
MTTTRSSTAASPAASTAGLQLDYLSSDEIASQSPAWWHNVLGVVGFERPPPIEETRVPITASMTPSLGANDEVCEVWRVAGPAVQLCNGAAQGSRVRYRFCDELLFGSITIDERLLEAASTARDAGALARATDIAYQEIFGVLRETEHRHLIRIQPGDRRRRALSPVQLGASTGVPQIGSSDRWHGACRECIGLTRRQPDLHLFPGRSPAADDDRKSTANQRVLLSAEVRPA